MSLSSKRALLVIDMLKDFIRPEGSMYCGTDGESIIPFIIRKIKEFKAEGSPIFFICDSHKPDDSEFNYFPRHCVQGTEGAEIVDELRSFAEQIVLKTKYNAFFATCLADYLAKTEEVHVVGVCTNICVLYTVQELFNLGKRPVVYRYGTASFDILAHEFALQQMEDILGTTIK